MDIKKHLQKLLKTQSLGVLCTGNNSGSYGSLVAFAGTEDLKQVVFATLRPTRKYANITADDNVALLVDNRGNKPADFRNASAATITGKAHEVSKRRNGRLMKLYLAKHPHLKEFIDTDDCALIVIDVEQYNVVSKFQETTQLQIKQ